MFENMIEALKQPDNKPILICLIAAIIGFILPLPYGFYILLRLGICGLLIWLTLRGPGFNKVFLKTLPGLLVIIALLLYNPLFLVHLGSKFVWLLLNLAAVALMLWLAKQSNKTV